MIHAHRFVLAATMVMLSGCTDTSFSDEPHTQTANIKSVAKTTPADDEVLRGICSIKPERTVKLKAQVGGEIKTVLVEQGTQVKKGEILATVDVRVLILKRERLNLEDEKLKQRSNLLRFQISRAEKEMHAMQALYSNNSVAAFSKEAAIVIERKSDLRDSELNQQLVQLDIKTVEDQIRKAEVRAPFDGLILVRTAEPGMVVASASEAIGGGEALFEIANPMKLQALCVAKEADALSLRNGMKVQILAEGEDSPSIEGKIVRMSPVISSEGGISRREFYVSLPSGETNTLLPGMNATATFKK